MPTGKGFTPIERQQIDEAIRAAELEARLEFSVFVGSPDGEPRGYAERLLSSLAAPERSVVVLVDPAGRRLEIVTGAEAHEVLDDEAVARAAAGMRAAFALDRLVEGITTGVRALAHHAAAQHA